MSELTFNPSRTLGSTGEFWRKLGIPSRGALLYKSLEQGLPYSTFTRLAKVTGLDKQSMASVVNIAPATLQRRIKAGHFQQDESDRLYRLAQVYCATLELFEGDTEAAQAWLHRPTRGLGGVRPIDMIVTSAQTNAVLDLIGRLEHGVFA